MDCYVYLLSCAGGALYCGWTNDVPARLAAHQSGRGAKYTRAHGPVELVYLERCADKSDALRREIAVKRLTHAQKLTLVEENRENTQTMWDEMTKKKDGR